MLNENEVKLEFIQTKLWMLNIMYIQSVQIWFTAVIYITWVGAVGKVVKYL